jgi:glutamyl-tRNA synthetase
MNEKEINKIAIKFAVYNAAQYDGTAQSGSVIGKILAEYPFLKSKVKEIMPIIKKSIKEVNSWTLEQQQSYLEENWPELLEKKKVIEEEKTLPPLENVAKYKMIKTRFAPNPDGSLHLGSAEPIIFCDEYAKMYDGHFILRYEDTSAEVKPPIPEMYDLILEDLEWLGVKVDEIYVQSERLEIYYKYAEKLLKEGKAYVCNCEVKFFRKLYMSKKPCPCRELSPETHLDRWQKMLNGVFEKGDAVVRIKTDLMHPNPAIRDWPALRISDVSHPLQGDKYRVWPLYNFSCGLDDHLMGVSHIIRGKEHDVNTTRQRWLHKHLGWSSPDVINIGRLGLEVGVLSKSAIRRGIEDGTYKGWDDPRLGTLQSLRKRGLQPEAIRKIMIHVGPKPVNVTISWDNIAAENRKIIEPISNRYFFVQDPIPLIVKNINKVLHASLPVHPDYPERGTREFTLSPDNDILEFVISEKDLRKLMIGGLVRLMGLINIEIIEIGDEIKTKLHSFDHDFAREKSAPFIHWLPKGIGREASVVLPDGTIAFGIAEERISEINPDTMFQFERFGYCRVDQKKPFVAYFTHN